MFTAANIQCKNLIHITISVYHIKYSSNLKILQILEDLLSFLKFRNLIKHIHMYHFNSMLNYESTRTTKLMCCYIKVLNLITS